MEFLDILVTIISFSFFLSIYFFVKHQSKLKKDYLKLKEGREVSEKEKIRVYLNQINEKFRQKNR